MITVEQMVSALCKVRGISPDTMTDSEVQADAFKEAKPLTDALNEILGSAPQPLGSDIDPTAGTDPKFNWGGDP